MTLPGGAGGGGPSSTAPAPPGTDPGSPPETAPPGPEATLAPVDPADPPAAPPTNPAFPDLDGRVPVGMFAPAVLRADQSERVVVEVQADAPPRQATLDHIRSLLGQVSDKPVDVVAGGAPGAGARSWDGDALRATADAGAVVAQGDGVAVLRLLFVQGDLGGDDSVLGIAVRGDVAAVFVDQVARSVPPLGSRDPIEMAVAAHEVGHLLGLVDLFRDTGRDDPEHPGHSTSSESVMYWAVESDVIGSLLGAQPPRDFDADDLADLASIRG